MAVSPAKRPVAPRERIGYEINYGGARERVGYNYDSASPRASSIDHEPWWRRIRTEERAGLLTFAGGLIWATKVQTIEISNIFRLLLTPGPLEISGIGLLVWLHAKWRRSVRIK